MFAGIFLLGLALMVCGAVLFIVLSLTRVHGSRTAAGWMIVVGFCLCLGDFLLLMWIVSSIGS